MKAQRLEKDTLGKIKVPLNTYFGAQTQRARENFPLSRLYPHQEYVFAVVIIKKAAAAVNTKLDLLDKRKAQAIILACDEILSGKLKDQFIVDPYQAGAGTSHNMNVNEVVANRANQILGAPLGSYRYIHPNDHVNMSQSTNDVIPTAIRLASLTSLSNFIEELTMLEKVFFQKSRQFKNILKIGRTHLQDALPITLGQEFSGYTKALANDRNRLESAKLALLHLGIGGTAVGTGINTHKDYHRMMVAELSRLTKLSFVTSANFFESMQNTADFLHLSSCLSILAQTLIRIGNDLRLLSSGPRTGLAEISLPAVQPGSSIMPGKVNPSIIEALTMVCFQVIGFQQTILLSSAMGQLELNVMLPLIAYNLLEQIRLLTNGVSIFRTRCVADLVANKKMCQFWLRRSMALATVLTPYLGYEKTAGIVKLALKTNKSIKEIAIEKGYLSRPKANKLFSIKNLTGPNLP